jgi:hypothetical protein
MPLQKRTSANADLAFANGYLPIECPLMKVSGAVVAPLKPRAWAFSSEEFT